MVSFKAIKFKRSIFNILVLYINTDMINLVKKSILHKIQKFPIFFKNIPIILNISNIENSIQWKSMYKEILSTGLHIIGVSGNINKILQASIIKSGLFIFLENAHYNKKNNYISYSTVKTKIIDIPVRSGQKIYSYQSDLIINNNVNSGAELIAGGNIYIYGTMRGRAIAGIYGDKTKRIFCTKCFSELVSIAGEYLLIDQIPKKLLGKGVYFFLKKNILSVYPLL